MIGASTAISPNLNGYVNSTQYKNSSVKTDSFEDKVSKIAADNSITASKSPQFSGDMVISQPPVYNYYNYDSTLANKSKEEMTMDEYKQWFYNEMSQMPVSAWYQSTCVGGSLIITDAAFERMKNDSEWESTIMNTVRKMYSTNGIMGSKMIGFQVIGASPEECYGEGIPVDSGSGLSTSNDGDSWWQKRHERMEEIIEEQIAKAIQRRQERREKIESDYVEELYQRQKNMLLNTTNGIDDNVRIQNVASVMEAYEKSSIVLSNKSD